jgi:geranylgeranyl pyrophosphate synthase
MIQQTLEETKKLVYPIIKSYLKDPVYPSQFKLNKNYQKEIDLYWKINNDYPSRNSKYLRPTFIRLVANALGVNTKAVLQASAAIQISQEWILISDDIEDNSDERRDKPTLHKIYGLELAVNASDALETVMWKSIVDIGNKKVVDEFYKIMMRTILGQAVEQIWTNKKVKTNIDQYTFVIDSKAGYYTVAGPLRIGAIIAGIKGKKLDKITDFGIHLGRCFQIVDDILDYEQDKIEGKVTIATSKGVEFAKKTAQNEKQIAKDIFDKELKFLSQEPARTKLIELIEFILERDH